MKEERILYLECYSGISGDMTVGALLDLGASRQVLEHALKSLGVGGYHLHFGRKKKCGIDAFDFDVHLEGEAGHNHDHDHHHDHEHSHDHNHDHSHHHDHVHRNLADIVEIIDRMDGADSVKALAKRMFEIVAEAESKAHGLPIEEVHFHEVGAIDSIVDIVSVAVCLNDLGITKVIVSPLSEGHGYVRCQHGVMPVPVPATANIANAYHLELKLTDNEGEMVTPTGAAIAAALHCGASLPVSYRIEKIGIGAGNKDFKNANILRAMVIVPAEKEDITKDQVVKLETNVDDCSGETLGFVMEELFAAGAADAWYTPIFMKKNRPAYLLTVLARESQAERMEEIIFAHTTTIGIRRTRMERTVVERSLTVVETELGPAQVKVCRKNGREVVYPEYESVKKISREQNIPFPEVYHLVKEQASGSQEKREIARQGETSAELADVRKRLEERMGEYAESDIAIAFSGGVDSSLLLAIACREAQKTGKKVYAVTFNTRLHAACDLEIARKVAEETGASHVVLEIDELGQAGIEYNPQDRCYRCKHLLFTRLREFAGEHGIDRILDGTNEDDLHVYRPGIRALRELGITSPLADLNITKAQVKALAGEYGISVAGRPSTPCMATRLPYGTKLDYQVLERIAEGEDWLRQKIGGNIRLRLHGDVARIEVDPGQMKEVLAIRGELADRMKGLGFPYVTLDLEGFRSGSMDISVDK